MEFADFSGKLKIAAEGVAKELAANAKRRLQEKALELDGEPVITAAVTVKQGGAEIKLTGENEYFTALELSNEKRGAVLQPAVFESGTAVMDNLKKIFE